MVHRIKTLLILCLDDISIAKEWDSIVIVKPYSNIDELNVDMDFVSKRVIKSKVNYDNSCTIVLFNLFYYHLSSFFAEERRNRKKRRRPELKGTHTSFFNYSMNSLRSNSISYLVAQPKVETRYNKKNLHAFQPFRAKCRHACRLEFLADFLWKVQYSNLKVQSVG